MKPLLFRSFQAAMIVLGCIALGWIVFKYASSSAQVVVASTSSPRPLSVEFTSLQARDLQERVQLAGTIFAVKDATVSARVEGRVKSVAVHLGDVVPGQQTIVEFDDTQLRVAMAAAENVVEGAQVQLRISRLRLEYPQRKLEYIRRMSKKGFASPLEVDQSKTNLEMAKDEVELSNLRLQGALVEKQRSELAIENTQVRAPLAGLVAQRFVDPGDFVRSGDALLRVIDISTVIAAVHVVEQDYDSIAIGQRADLRVDALAGRTFIGKVVRISPILDVQTRTAVVYLHIDNPRGRLKPGMQARVSITVHRHAGAQVLPIASLIERSGQPAVFVLAGRPPTAERRRVKVGLVDDEYVEVLSGVSPVDRVVTLGSHLLSDGQLVEAVRGDTMGKVFAANE